jgi:hypothetical protein
MSFGGSRGPADAATDRVGDRRNVTRGLLGASAARTSATANVKDRSVPVDPFTSSAKEGGAGEAGPHQ